MIVVWGVAVGGEHHDVVPRGTQALYETLKSVLHAAHVAEGAGLLRARRQEEHCCTAWERPQERTMQRWGGCILARSKEGWRRSTPAFLQVEVNFKSRTHVLHAAWLIAGPGLHRRPPSGHPGPARTSGPA